MKDETPRESGCTIKEQFAYQPITDHDDIAKTLSPALDGLTVADATVKKEKETDQEKPPTLMQAAEALRNDVIRLARTLSKPAKEHKVDLTEHFAKLQCAESIEEILELIRMVLVRINCFRVILSQDFKAKQESLRAAEAKKKPDDIIALHKQMALKYKLDEDNARSIWTDLKTRTEDLATRMVVEQC